MRRDLAGRLGSLLLLLVLVIMAVGCAWLLLARGLDWSDKVGSTGAFLVAALVLLLPAIRRLWQNVRGHPPVSETDVAQAREDLARALVPQWAEEERLRRVNDPRPLPVRWRVAPDGARSLRHETGTVPAEADLAGRFDEVLEVFNRIPGRRMVLLGPAGAGKSVLAIKLIRELLAARAPGDPVPVLIPAMTWRPGAGLPGWIAAELETGHPGLAGRVTTATGETMSLAAAISRGDGVLPVIDGLDELPPERREEALRTLNDHGSGTPLLVTCRPEEYREAVAAGRPISRAVAVELLPLRPEDAETYLTEATAPVHEARWREVVDRLGAEPGGTLAAVLTTPLMLWLARTVYESPDAEPRELADRNRFQTRESVEHHLLDALVPAVYAPRPGGTGRPYDGEAVRARRWLSFLAAHLTGSGTPDLAWWRLRNVARGWLGPSIGMLRGLLYGALGWAAIVVLLVWAGHWEHGSLVGGVPLGELFDGPLGRVLREWWLTGDAATSQPRQAMDPLWRNLLEPSEVFGLPWLVLGAGGLAVVEVVGTSQNENAPRAPSPSTLRVTAPRLARAIVMGVAYAATAAFFVLVFANALAVEKAVPLGQVFRDQQRWGLWLLCAVIVLIVVLSRLLVPVNVSAAASPSELLRQDRRAAMTRRLLFRTLLGTAVWLIAGPVVAAVFAAYAAIVIVLGFGLGQMEGAWPSYREAWFRLALRGRLPWRTMAFLDDAHQRGVLRQVGAVYQFRHIRLQEKLAAEYSPWPLPLRPAGERFDQRRRRAKERLLGVRTVARARLAALRRGFPGALRAGVVRSWAAVRRVAVRLRGS